MKRYIRWKLWQKILELYCKLTKHKPIRMNPQSWICDRCNYNIKN